MPRGKSSSDPYETIRALSQRLVIDDAMITRAAEAIMPLCEGTTVDQERAIARAALEAAIGGAD